MILGVNLPSNNDWTASLLTNSEEIAVDQHSMGNSPLLTTNGAHDLVSHAQGWERLLPGNFDRA